MLGLAGAAAMTSFATSRAQDPPPPSPAPPPAEAAPAPPAPAAAVPAAPPTAPAASTVGWTTRNPAGFIAMTPAKASFALAGTMAMIGAGEQIVKENLITEPAGVLSRDLARVVAERTGGAVAAEPTFATALKPEEIAAGAKGARYVVDVTTMGWGYQYQPFKWTAFNASYYARLQVVDGAGKLLVKDTCVWPKKGQSETTSQDGLLADHARELKLRIMAGKLACRAQFLTKIEELKL